MSVASRVVPLKNSTLAIEPSVSLAAAASMATGKPFVIVRNQKKDYGTSKLVEGVLKECEHLGIDLVEYVYRAEEKDHGHSRGNVDAHVDADTDDHADAETHAHTGTIAEPNRHFHMDTLSTAASEQHSDHNTAAQLHAAAQKVSVRLAFGSDRIDLEVQDDGVGFDPAAVDADRYGLTGMQERAAMIGATLEISSRPAGGTRVWCTIPR